MDWFPFFQSKNPKSIISSEEDCDPQACYDSFKEHWHQALKILQRVQVNSLKTTNIRSIYATN